MTNYTSRDFKRWLIESKTLNTSSNIAKEMIIKVLLSDNGNTTSGAMGALNRQGYSVEEVRDNFGKYISRFKEVLASDTNCNPEELRLPKGAVSKQFQVVKQMPPLKHKKSSPFDIMESDVCKWLMFQPEILQYIFNRINNSGFIKFNPDTGTWQGVDYQEERSE